MFQLVKIPPVYRAGFFQKLSALPKSGLLTNFEGKDLQLFQSARFSSKGLVSKWKDSYGPNTGITVLTLLGSLGENVAKEDTILPLAYQPLYERLISYRIAVVPSSWLSLPLFLLGAKGWGIACTYQRPPLGQPLGQTWKWLFLSLALWLVQRWSLVDTCIAPSFRS